jgi:2'-hydroxyisoflavone reductase
VRDVAGFAVRSAAEQVTGAFNLAAPIGRETFGGMLRACAEVTRSGAKFVWVPDQQLLAHGVRQWSQMPLWRVTRGVWQVDSSTAVARGLSCRPLAETVADTWSWMRDEDPSAADTRASEIGIVREFEQRILAKVA